MPPLLLLLLLPLLLLLRPPSIEDDMEAGRWEGNMAPEARRRARATCSIMWSTPRALPTATAASSPSGAASLQHDR